MPSENESKPTERPSSKSSGPRVSQLLADAQTEHRDEQIARLQERLTDEKDARKEERFVGIFCLVFLLDVVLFYVMESFLAPAAIVILQLMILFPLAKRMGMEEIAQMLDRVLTRIADVHKNID